MQHFSFACASLLACALSVAACGDDDDDTGGGGAGGGTGGASSGGTSSVAGSSAGGLPGTGGTAGSSATGGTTGGGAGGSAGSAGASSEMSFFVTSTGNATGDLGGLDAADQKCLTLATAVGHGDKTWRAYLSVENGPGGGPVHAKDRIGSGPWHNSKGELIAANLTELHEKDGDYQLFLDENGDPVPGQWQGSPTPNVHDILTGSNRDGTLKAGNTCDDWTSSDSNLTAWVGHSDGLGPGGDDAENYRPWNSVHENGGCNDTAPRGGGGRIYCFALSE